MCDLETTGISPDHASIIQIAAVRFDLASQSVDAEDMFDRCLFDPPGRYWEEGTRTWWMGKNRPVLEKILPRREAPEKVLMDFQDWCLDLTKRDSNKPLVFWSKPTSFDYPLLSSYFRQFDMVFPFHYRAAVDVNSFIRGLARDTDAELNYSEFHGDQHNALFDVLNQIGNVFAAMNYHAS